MWKSQYIKRNICDKLLSRESFLNSDFLYFILLTIWEFLLYKYNVDNNQNG